MAEAKLYDELAEWWPLLSAPADYAEEAEQYRGLFVEASEAPPRTLLELGSGGGNNASHLKPQRAVRPRPVDAMARERGLLAGC
jgi:D-serine deaminase-like pyridoxal phosphate-dependent protein